MFQEIKLLSKHGFELAQVVTNYHQITFRLLKEVMAESQLPREFVIARMKFIIERMLSIIILICDIHTTMTQIITHSDYQSTYDQITDKLDRLEFHSMLTEIQNMMQDSELRLTRLNHDLEQTHLYYQMALDFL